MIKGIRPRLAEAGKIKIGGLGDERQARGGGKYRLPVKYDYFLITKTERSNSGDFEVDKSLMSAIQPDADGKIRSIPIVVHSDKIDDVFPTSYALYTGRKCACRGDGEKAIRREIRDKQYTGATKEIDCTCDYLGAEKGPVCKPNGKLSCSIAAPNSAIAGAVHVWRTTSIISIEQMLGSLLQIKSICGTLKGVPLWLRVKPITVEPSGRSATTVYCCHVELRASDIAEVQHNAIETARLRRELGGDEIECRLLPPSEDEETVEEQEDIAQEFYSEDESNVMGEGETASEQTPSSSIGVLTSKLKADQAEPTEQPPTEDPKPDPAPKAEVVTKPAEQKTETPRLDSILLKRLRENHGMTDDEISGYLGGPIKGAPTDELERVLEEADKRAELKKKRGGKKNNGNQGDLPLAGDKTDDAGDF